MLNLNIVHISPTPLVGAPSKLAAAQRRAGQRAISIALSDYPKGAGLYEKFTTDMLVWSDAEIEVSRTIERYIEEADIIHIHNDLPPERAAWLTSSAKRTSFVYQVHSPLREGPLYVRRANEISLPFRAHLVVAQYQPRHYPDYQPVANIVLDTPSVHPREKDQKLRVMYSPTHARGGRWNSKYSSALENALSALAALNKIEVVQFEKPVHPNTLMTVRRTCHVSIDEIVTGGFHQVSLEGLCAGTVVINRADYFSKVMLASSANTNELPPFVYADDTNISDVLIDLANDPAKTANLQCAGYEYFKHNLQPENLVKKTLDVYQRII